MTSMAECEVCSGKIACDTCEQFIVSVADDFHKVRSEIVSALDSVSGCYECPSNCAVDHMTVTGLNNALELLERVRVALDIPRE